MWTAAGLAALAFPFLSLAIKMLRGPRWGQSWGAFIRMAADDLGTAAARFGLQLAFMAHDASARLHAIGITLIRLGVTRHRLLEWETLAASAARQGAAMPGTVLLPVPLHPKRHAERGFNQAETIARHAALWLGLPVRADGLVRRRDTAPQTALRGAQRRRNLAQAFAPAAMLGVADSSASAGAAIPARFVLVDDVLTTGATLAAARAALREAGFDAAGVWVVATARRRGSVRAQRVIEHDAGEDRHTDPIVEAERAQAVSRLAVASDP